MSARKTEFEGKHVFIFTRDGWEFVERKSAKEAVAVIAATDDGKIVLTEQYRRPVDRRVIDLPAGLIGDEDDSDAAATAKKELEEETGYRCRAVERLAGGPSSPGITSEIVHLYRATGLTREGAGGGVGGEEITVHAVPLRDAEQWLRDKEKDGVLVDLKVWSALYFVGRHGA
ncbi:MAG: ADP-ribose pyrophosphatase [Acidobacteriota bacterium]|jgi:ADP-ribose pyrophosphatase|nr:ADP-ribose pyrophosphatase [Acidobacteriota bacterium]